MEKGSIYFNDPYGKYDTYSITKNGFLGGVSHRKPHDIKVYVQTKDGEPVALVIQVANPGTLALSEAEFERRNEPTAFIKCDYKNTLPKEIYLATEKIVRFFDMHKDEENRQYYAMIQASAFQIPKEGFEKIEFNFGY